MAFPNLPFYSIAMNAKKIISLLYIFLIVAGLYYFLPLLIVGTLSTAIGAAILLIVGALVIYGLVKAIKQLLK